MARAILVVSIGVSVAALAGLVVVARARRSAALADSFYKLTAAADVRVLK